MDYVVFVIVLSIVILLMVWYSKADAELWNKRNRAIEEASKKKRAIEEASKKKRAIEEASKKKRQYESKQLSYYKQMITFGENSITEFESMPGSLDMVEYSLNQAEIDFSDGAFAPFWSSIETAVKSLGFFDGTIQIIKNNSSGHIDLKKMYHGTAPKFPLSKKSIEKLTVSTLIIERMNKIVRKAQLNFKFSTIYEQRRTNQILIAGFTNLADVLDNIAYKITDSINSLSDVVESMNKTIGSKLDGIAESNAQYQSEHLAAVESMAESNAQYQSEHLDREKKALEMLDNIQRGRKPFL